MRLYPFIIPVLASAMALSSCDKQGDIIVIRGREITFSSTMAVDVKSFTETDSDKLQADGFKVTGVVDNGGSVLLNTTVTKGTDGRYHTSDGKYYFPLGGTVSFYAAYPPTEAITTDGTGRTYLAYTHDPDKDLVVACTKSVSDNGSPVSLAFSHALCRIAFDIKGEDSNLTYTLSSFKAYIPKTARMDIAGGTWNSQTIEALELVSSPTTVGTVTSLGDFFSMAPCETDILVEWSTSYNSEILGQSSEILHITPTAGNMTRYTLALPKIGIGNITCTCDVQPWTEQNMGHFSY